MEEKKKRKKALTNKQENYILNRLENPKAEKKDMALKAGYSESTARSISQVEAGIKQIIQYEFEKMGLTSRVAARKMLEGLNAHKKTYIKMKTKKGKESIITKADPDFAVRYQYLRLYADIQGLIVKRFDVGGSGPTEIPMDLSSRDAGVVKAELERIMPGVNDKIINITKEVDKIKNKKTEEQED